MLLPVVVAGCTVWSKRLDRYDIVVDDPASVEVRVEGIDGVRTVVPAGGGDVAQPLAVGRHALTFTRREAEGVRIACETCMGPMILVGPSGRLLGSYDPRTATVEVGQPVVARRPYYLARMDQWGTDWWDSTAWHRSVEEGLLVELHTDWGHVRRVDAFQKPARGVGWVMLLVAGMASPLGLALVGEQETVVPGLAVLGGTAFVGWSGARTAFGSARPVVVYDGTVR